jgi:hypothetical protein
MAVNEKAIIKIIGYILLSPALIGIIRYYIILYNKTVVSSDVAGNLIPIYFGLMAIAGAYLIKDKN